MTLSIIVMAALIPINSVALRAVLNVQQIEDQLNRLHQSITLLDSDLRSTALTGCATEKSLMINSLNQQPAQVTQLPVFQWISGYSNDRWFPDPPLLSTSIESKDQDALHIVKADMSGLLSTASIASFPQRVLLITNCHYLEITRAIDATLIKPGLPNTTPSVYSLQFIQYYVKDIAGTQTLYRQYLSRSGRPISEPLLDNIDQFRVGYGERLNNTTIKFKPAASVGDWKKVVAIYVMISLSDVLNKPVSMVIPLTNHSYD